MEGIRHLLQDWLENVGFRVLTAGSGREALRLFGEATVDVVVTDVVMPDSDGIEVILQLRRSRRQVPILAISGGGARLRADQCLEMAQKLGAQGVLLKPFGRDQFFAALRRVLAAGEPPGPTGIAKDPGDFARV